LVSEATMAVTQNKCNTHKKQLNCTL